MLTQINVHVLQYNGADYEIHFKNNQLSHYESINSGSWGVGQCIYYSIQVLQRNSSLQTMLQCESPSVSKKHSINEILKHRTEITCFITLSVNFLLEHPLHTPMHLLCKCVYVSIVGTFNIKQLHQHCTNKHTCCPAKPMYGYVHVQL